MKKILFVFIMLIMNTLIFGQGKSSTIFTKGDIIRLELTENSEYFYIHEMHKGQSLYGLTKIFNVPLSKLYDINGLQKGSVINVDQKIKVPILDELLFKGTSLEGLKHGHYIPVYYQTKPKDNLFRISRIYFNQPTKDLAIRNKLEDNGLALGQDLLIGWFPIDTAPPIVHLEEFEEEFETPNDLSIAEKISKSESSDEDTEKVEIGPEMVKDSSIQEEVRPTGFNVSLLGTLAYKTSIKEIKKSEVANWDKSMIDNGMVYVLHRSAIIDTYIEMYNPLRKKSVRAKVIGRIPYGAYPENVSLVLSPRTAKQLGALDSRFKVEVKALINEE